MEGLSFFLLLLPASSAPEPVLELQSQSGTGGVGQVLLGLSEEEGGELLWEIPGLNTAVFLQK